MTFGWRCLSAKPLSKEVIGVDKQTVEQYGDCGLGKKAIYVGAFGVPRLAYIPLDSVKRVYKRLAVSKGFYESGKIYGSLAYLVIKYDDDKEKAYRFNNEDVLDMMLKDIKSKTSIPVGKE